MARVKNVEDRNVGKAVMIAGYTFRDQSAVKAWINVIGDKEIFRFCHDMKMQITGILLDDFVSTGDGLNQIAQSNKAN